MAASKAPASLATDACMGANGRWMPASVIDNRCGWPVIWAVSATPSGTASTLRITGSCGAPTTSVDPYSGSDSRTNSTPSSATGSSHTPGIVIWPEIPLAEESVSCTLAAVPGVSPSLASKSSQ